MTFRWTDRIVKQEDGRAILECVPLDDEVPPQGFIRYHAMFVVTGVQQGRQVQQQTHCPIPDAVDLDDAFEKMDDTVKKAMSKPKLVLAK